MFMKNRVFLIFMMLVCMVTTSFANDNVKESNEPVIIGHGYVNCYQNDEGCIVLYLDIEGERYSFDNRTMLLDPTGRIRNKRREVIDSYGRARIISIGYPVTCFRFNNSPSSVYDFVLGVRTKEDIVNIAKLSPEEVDKINPTDKFWLVIFCDL